MAAGEVHWNDGSMTATWMLITVDGSDDENWIYSESQSVEGKYRYDCTITTDYKSANSNECVCSHFTYRGVHSEGIWLNSSSGDGIRARIACDIANIDDFKA